MCDQVIPQRPEYLAASAGYITLYVRITMTVTNLGNALYQLVTTARNALSDQGELAQLTYGVLAPIQY